MAHSCVLEIKDATDGVLQTMEDRSAAFRSCALSLEKVCSIGLKSGLYGGRNRGVATMLSTAARTAGAAVQFRYEETGHIGEERIGVHRAVEHLGGNQAGAT